MTTVAVVAVAGVPTSPMARPQTTVAASDLFPTFSPHPVRQRGPRKTRTARSSRVCS